MSLLDRSIVFSYDRSGFRRHAKTFDQGDIAASLKGLRVLVTGGNSGIGFATAERLASQGAHVSLLCRSPQWAEAAVAEILRQHAGASVDWATLDLASFSSVRACAERFSGEAIDVVVHNAGVLPDSFQRTADGLELTLQVNLVAPFLLTQLLRPALQRAGPARLIWVSSGGMYSEKLVLKRLQMRAGAIFDGVVAYARAKRAMVVLTEELARRLPSVGVFSMHPGWADTPAVRSSLPRFYRITRSILRTPAEGADTVVWLAQAPGSKLTPGGFYFDRSLHSPYLMPWTKESPEERPKLWAQLLEWTAEPWTSPEQ